MSPDRNNKLAKPMTHIRRRLLIGDPRLSHLIRTDPALLGEELRQGAHYLIAACGGHSRDIRFVSLDARDGGIGHHRSRGDSALNRRACAKHGRRARHLAAIRKGGKFEHPPRTAALVNLRARFDCRGPGAKTDHQTPQWTAFVDRKKLPVDQQFISSRRSAAAYALDSKSQLAQAIGNFFGESVFHLLGDEPLALDRILYARLLPHDSLVFENVPLAHGEVINEYPGGLGQVLLLCRLDVPHSGLAACGKPESRQRYSRGTTRALNH